MRRKNGTWFRHILRATSWHHIGDYGYYHGVFCRTSRALGEAMMVVEMLLLRGEQISAASTAIY